MLRALCQHILAPQLTEPVKLFIIPALVELSYFPFRQLLEAIKLYAHDVPATTWLMYTILSLEKKHFGKKQYSMDLDLMHLLLLCGILQAYHANLHMNELYESTQ